MQAVFYNLNSQVLLNELLSGGWTMFLNQIFLDIEYK